MAEVKFSEGAAASTPSAAQVTLYAKADGLLYSKDDAGTETLVSGGSSSNHALLSATHSDTVANAVTRGSLVYANATPAWDELVIGAANRVLGSDGTDVAWVQADHGAALTGLADDDHTQYALLAGRSAGQILTGGTAASDDLTLRPTSDATKGDVIVADQGGNVIIGGGATASELRLLEPSGSGTNYTAFKTQAQAANITYTLPPDDGDASEVLQTDGSGSLTWVAQTGGTSVQELVFTAAANTPPTASFATPDTRNNHPVLDFDGTADESAVFGAVLPTTYASGGLSVDIYWTATSATSGDCVWLAGIERMKTG